jgi:hypothetical protein
LNPFSYFNDVKTNKRERSRKWQNQNAINVLGVPDMMVILNLSWAVSGGGISTGAQAGRPL